MSLETLLEAAKFLEHKTDETKTSNTHQNSVESHPHDPTMLRVASMKEMNQHQIINQYNPNIISLPSEPGAKEASGGRIASVRSIHREGDLRSRDMAVADMRNQKMDIVAMQLGKSVSKTNENLPSRFPSEFPTLDANQSQLSLSSNMDPLFARANAAVKNASFGDGDGVIIPPPRNIPGSALTISAPRRVVIDQLSYKPNGALALPIQQRYVPVNVSVPKPAPVVATAGQNKPPDLPMEQTISILPSLKSSMDASSFSTLEIKQVKRSVTLTHNQLEKNRRAHLKERFEALKASIPRLGMRRSSNLTILKAALKQIQILKRKSVTHQHVLAQLHQEREERKKKEAALYKDMLQVAGKQKIESFIADTIREAGAKISPPISLLDSSQLSTSTASEAEDEEERQNNSYYNEILFRPVSSHLQMPTEERNLEPMHQQLASTLKTELKPERTLPNSSAFMLHTQTSRPRDQMLINDQSQGSSARNTMTSSETRNTATDSQSQKPRLAVPQKPHAELFNSGEKTKKSPLRTQPTRRSVTPTPSSDFVQFFPRFSMGSGGSPPLMATPKFEFSNKALKVIDKTPQPSTQNRVPTPSATHLPQSSVETSRVVPLIPPSDINATEMRATSEHLNSATDTVPAAVVSRRHSAQSTPTASTSDASNLSPSKTVIVTSFSGYEVKVKYLNPAAPSTASMKAFQARMPMKKRPVNVDAFSTQSVEAPRPPRNESSQQPSNASSELKMTSLYVGASASLLDSSSSTGPTSTSDYESDRESPFFDRKKHKYPNHWRKNLLHEQNKDSNEHKTKSVEKSAKKRTFQVHQYEGPEAKTSSTAAKVQTEAKRKATFNLWNRKHHAITMTTATNWRGKQQLITSKPKPAVVTTAPAQTDATPKPSPGGNSVTKVSYSLLQKTVKPSVSSSLINSQTPTQIVAASPSTRVSQPPVAVSPHDLKKLAPSNLATGNVGLTSLPRSRYQPVQAFPYQFPGSAVHIIQAPASTTVAQPMSSTARDVSGMNSQTRMYSSVPTMFAPPPNFVTVSGVNTSSSSESVKESMPLSETTALLQQTALLTAQPNSLQMPQIPCVFPISYVMYPHGVSPNSMQLALQPPAKVYPANNIVVQQPPRPTLQRPASPLAPSKHPSRNDSNGSASSTTLSVDSTDMDSSSKNGPILPKTARVEPLPITPISGSDVAAAQHTARLAQSQFIVPGNPGFMVAAPTSNGFSLPFNLMGYPLQAYPGPGGLQALPLPAGVAPGQALHGISQVWPLGPTLIPAGDGRSGLVTMATMPSNSNSLSAPLQRSGKVD